MGISEICAIWINTTTAYFHQKQNTMFGISMFIISAVQYLHKLFHDSILITRCHFCSHMLVRIAVFLVMWSVNWEQNFGNRLILTLTLLNYSVVMFTAHYALHITQYSTTLPPLPIINRLFTKCGIAALIWEKNVCQTLFLSLSKYKPTSKQGMDWNCFEESTFCYRFLYSSFSPYFF